MIPGCADAGYSSLAFKPHPSAAATQVTRLHEVARSCDVRLAVADERELAEAWYERGGVELVVGRFSTALLTALQINGLSVARLGTEIDVGTADTLHNSNRIPVSLWMRRCRISPRRRLRRLVRRSRRALGRQLLGAPGAVARRRQTKINAALSRPVSQWCPGSRQDVQKANSRYPRAWFWVSRQLG